MRLFYTLSKLSIIFEVLNIKINTMKIEKLELKHICGYLPYVLKCEYYGITDVQEYNKYVGAFLDIPESSSGGMGLKVATLKEIKIFKKYWTAHIGIYRKGLKTFVNGYGFKPLLLPLSALTEPLPDGTVPIVELAKIAFPNLNWKLLHGYAYSTSNDAMMWYDNHGSFVYDIGFISNQLQLFEYLYSKHFDIYGLIDAGLAIDKRTVKF